MNKKNNFTLFKRENDIISKSTELKDIFEDYKENKEHWVFIMPHDDDAVLGSGILMQKARQENVAITVIITTDGSMGYNDVSLKDEIVEIRRMETNESFALLDIDKKDIVWLDFPDCSVKLHVGRRTASKGDPCIIEGCTGLQNAYTYYLRKYAPTRVFIATGQDLHPDHKIVHEEALISVFQSCNGIWLDLGLPAGIFPDIYEMAIYCDFDGIPDIKITATDEILDKKLEAISVYRSQGSIIDKLVEKVKAAGPVEYFKKVSFALYSPENYKGVF